MEQLRGPRENNQIALSTRNPQSGARGQPARGEGSYGIARKPRTYVHTVPGIAAHSAFAGILILGRNRLWHSVAFIVTNWERRPQNRLPARCCNSRLCRPPRDPPRPAITRRSLCGRRDIHSPASRNIESLSLTTPLWRDSRQLSDLVQSSMAEV
jgi:hypothetical protein